MTWRLPPVKLMTFKYDMVVMLRVRRCSVVVNDSIGENVRGRRGSWKLEVGRKKRKLVW